MTLQTAHGEGRRDAFRRFKLAATPTHAVVRGSSLLGGKSPEPKIEPPPVLTPPLLQQAFNAQEQVATKQDPDRKLAATDVCTTCRQPKHYGPCKAAPRSVETILKTAGEHFIDRCSCGAVIAQCRCRGPKTETVVPNGCERCAKTANFNSGLYGDGVDNGQSDAPSMSPHYTAATVSDSGPARARPGDPLAQARSTHQDFGRPSFMNQAADEWQNAYGALVKTCRASKIADALIPGGSWERRGPFVDPYAERLLRLSPPVARGPVGDQAVDHAFGQIDSVADSTSIESGAGQPQGGPAALG